MHAHTLNWIEVEFNSIGLKWDANWCMKYWNFVHGHGVGKKQKQTYLKRHKSFHASLLGNGLNRFHDRIWKMKHYDPIVILPKLI